jgi:PAS domain S-box-containing protein
VKVKASPDQTQAGPRRGQTVDLEFEPYAELFDLAPIAYLSLDVDQTIRKANRAAAALLGREPACLPGANFRLFVAEHSSSMLDEFLTQTLASGRTRSCQIDLSREEHSLPIVLTARPCGTKNEYLVTMTDLGKRRLEAEQELLEVKARYRSLAAMSSNFYWRTDAEHRVTRTDRVSNNRGVCTFMPSEIIGMRRWEIPYLSPDETGWEAHRAVLEARQPFRIFQLSCPGIDGTERHISISGDPVFDASGAFIGYHGLGRDITERKLAERTLSESEERYRSLFANAGDGILIVSRNGKIIAANESFARMHGYSTQEIMATELKDLVTPETFRSAPERWSRISSGELMTVEVEHCHKDGHVFPVEISASVISSGNETHMQFLYRDITERKRNEAALIAANRLAQSANHAKTRFLAAASHDLRQPVQAINLFLDALAQTSQSVEQKEISNYLCMSVRSLRELLNTLLDISQLEAGAVKPELEVISSESLLRELEVEFAHLAKEKKLRLNCFAPHGLLLLSDPRLLQRALRNIIGNAIKYTERGGILMGVRRRGAHALVQIWDTGIGIAPEHLGRIFEEYFQIANPARDRSKGMGLGLAIVERLVKLIDSEIECRSRPGGGTVFEIKLPLACGPEQADKRRVPQPASSPDARALQRFKGRRVVVVEDDPLVAKSLEQTLGALGAAVALFGNAEEALASPAAADLYISDFRLPGRFNGVELLEAIQQRSAKPINAVLMTGETSSNLIELSASASWKILFKPVDLRVLLSLL